MDPIAISAKQRYKEPKSKPNHKSLTPFQQKLQHNPYGMAPMVFLNCSNLVLEEEAS